MMAAVDLAIEESCGIVFLERMIFVEKIKTIWVLSMACGQMHSTIQCLPIQQPCTTLCRGTWRSNSVYCISDWE